MDKPELTLQNGYVNTLNRKELNISIIHICKKHVHVLNYFLFSNKLLLVVHGGNKSHSSSFIYFITSALGWLYLAQLSHTNPHNTHMPWTHTHTLTVIHTVVVQLLHWVNSSLPAAGSNYTCTSAFPYPSMTPVDSYLWLQSTTSHIHSEEKLNPSH